MTSVLVRRKLWAQTQTCTEGRYCEDTEEKCHAKTEAWSNRSTKQGMPETTNKLPKVRNRE